MEIFLGKLCFVCTGDDTGHILHKYLVLDIFL